VITVLADVFRLTAWDVFGDRRIFAGLQTEPEDRSSGRRWSPQQPESLADAGGGSIHRRLPEFIKGTRESKRLACFFAFSGVALKRSTGDDTGGCQRRGPQLIPPFWATCPAPIAKRLHRRVYFGYVKVSGGDIFEVE